MIPPTHDPTEVSDNFLQVALDQVEGLIADCSISQSEPMLFATRYQVGTRGKMVRARLLILTTFLYQSDLISRSLSLAAVVELAHMATLLHDDVIDVSDRRREKPTLNAIAGNKMSILCGDYLLARALDLLAEHGDAAMIQAVTRAMSAAVEGELLQHSHAGNLNICENTYFEIAEQKTGKLFAVSAELGALVGGANMEESAALSQFGLLLGTAFQLADDLIDYAGSTRQNGKPIGSDLRGGIATPPLIKAVRSGSAADRTLLNSIFGIAEVNPLRFKAALEVVRRQGGLAYTATMARNYANRAVECLEALRNQGGRYKLERFARNLIEERLIIAADL